MKIPNKLPYDADKQNFWPAIIGAAAGMGGGIISGIMGKEATRDTNQTNQANAREQMAFQERMSNTAHQRQQADMMAAGLNPALSAGQGGAGNPGGAMSTGQAPDMSFVGKAMQGGISNALSILDTQATLKQKTADTGKTVAETLNTIEQAKVIAETVKGQRLANAKSEKINPTQIQTAKIEMDRATTAKAREQAEERYKSLRAKEDEKGVWWDKKSEQAGQFLDNITSGLNVFKMFAPAKKPWDKNKTQQHMYRK